jgi:hypothetical protein
MITRERKEREGPCFPSPPLERPRRLEGVFLLPHHLIGSGRCIHTAASALWVFSPSGWSGQLGLLAFNVIQMVFRTSLSSFPLMLYPFRLIVSLSRACLAFFDLWKYVFLSLLHSPKKFLILLHERYSGSSTSANASNAEGSLTPRASTSTL